MLLLDNIILICKLLVDHILEKEKKILVFKEESSFFYFYLFIYIYFLFKLEAFGVCYFFVKETSCDQRCNILV